MKYSLKYKDIEVGTVEGKEADFLNLCGSFEISDFEDVLLSNFIDVSIKESDLVEEDHIRDISSEMAKLQVEMQPLLQFIESEDWVLVTER